ncbi:MAG TPA: helix-turn-helix domain-containing protein [Candidatus Omnitrophota bacterium]|jgi:excisionase family DNA binding protein|nr:MAG: Helix-turn-helix domain protein [Candidatus Omnitrophica bacterium ADurb.Bin314]HOE68033.1 helix-turn-helix domain-containing protein [Candidatus Omnitrophota bacterium]HQB94609.1 helix-turn-helix domain-containing protein [Candidatus Omnitrophota bacterium]
MERLMTARQVSELLEVNPSTVYQWVHLGLIPYVKLGKCVRFKKIELFRWIDKNLRHEKVSFKTVEKVLRKHPSARQKEFSDLE